MATVFADIVKRAEYTITITHQRYWMTGNVDCEVTAWRSHFLDMTNLAPCLCHDMVQVNVVPVRIDIRLGAQ